MAERRGPPTLALSESLPGRERGDLTAELASDAGRHRHEIRPGQAPDQGPVVNGGAQRHRATPLPPAGSTQANPGTVAGDGIADCAEGRIAPLGELLPDRYEDLGCIGSGGFSEVRRVRDRVLRRVLAMKVLRADFVHLPHMRARFLNEARITAQLQHPAIVAVHDQGELADGRLWFTMKEVRGRTLRSAIEEVHEAAGPDGFVEAPSGWTFRRVLDAFARISQAVAFAHSRRVMHRDLKPENIMVGEFGEVLVMDWGLARRVDADGDSLPGFISVDIPPSSLSIDGGLRPPQGPTLDGGAGNLPPDELREGLTQHGDVLGTPAYMPPEQARGQRELHGPHSDVYSLGAILYHILSGKPPYTGSGARVLYKVATGPPPPLAEVLQGRPPVPDELVAVCERAMQREIPDRYPGAEPLSAEIVAFLEGARRREQALAVLADARRLEPDLSALRARAARCREEAQARLAEVQPYDPVDQKRGGWALEDEAAALGRQAAIRETEWLQTVHGALTLHPELPEAHALLADHYRDRLSAAELGRDEENAARFEAQLRAHDRGRHAAFLRGEGALTLVTDPPGAEVRLERYELHDRRLVPVDAGPLGTTPLRAVPLQRGSYRLRIRAPGRAEVLYPVLISRGDHWDGRPPGESDPQPILLPAEGELGPDDCYVPAGWCWTGGDPEAPDSLPLRRVWIDGFVMRRFPVTNREYLEFLNDLVAGGRVVEALAACPRAQLGMADAVGERLAFGRDDKGLFVLVDDELGRPSDPNCPVVLVDWHGARGYSAWLATRARRPWRLPDELEREKAARGVDARFVPWGDHLDATFARTVESCAAEPMLWSVHGHPIDESPYDVRGLAGNSRDWCGNVWTLRGPLVQGGRLVLESAASDDPNFRSVRGGAWSTPLSLIRSAARFGLRPSLRRGSTGMRVVRSI